MKKYTKEQEELIRELAFEEEKETIMNYESIEGVKLENKEEELEEQKERIRKMKNSRNCSAVFWLLCSFP
ncbi:hypothetical protein [Bacillus sp. NPDC094106]|uniref:hypothetical protein n=1 Tax=Bacillus sp. NPDC094106 TaxID=3363949 RepID=UPI0038255F31